MRRMLLTQKAMAEGGRMLAYSTALLVDKDAFASDEDQRKEASELLALLTPIAKAFMTETGFECASLALQCFGGHGIFKNGVWSKTCAIAVSPCCTRALRVFRRWIY